MHPLPSSCLTRARTCTHAHTHAHTHTHTYPHSRAVIATQLPHPCCSARLPFALLTRQPDAKQADVLASIVSMCGWTKAGIIGESTPEQAKAN